MSKHGLQMKMSVIHNGSFNNVFSYSFSSFRPADVLLLLPFSYKSPLNVLPFLSVCLQLPFFTSKDFFTHICICPSASQSSYSYIHFEMSFSSWYFSLCLPLTDHISPSMPRCHDRSLSLTCFTCLNLQLPSFHSLCSLLPSACPRICSFFFFFFPL